MKAPGIGFLFFYRFWSREHALPLPANLGIHVQNTYLWRVRAGKCGPGSHPGGLGPNPQKVWEYQLY